MIANLIKNQPIIPTKQTKILTAGLLDSPLCEMITIGDNHAIYLLKFTDEKNIKESIYSLLEKYSAQLTSGSTPAIESIRTELQAYFDGSLTAFKTPLHLEGTDFQKNAWNALTKIPYSSTRSYLQQAHGIGKPSACRAVANANGKNNIVIAIPCHRIINNNGNLGGYNCGLYRKTWLLKHEQSHKTIHEKK